MTMQPNEQVYYDADGIFISQYRFVTPDGSTYPTNTMQRVWGSVDRSGDGNSLLGIFGRVRRLQQAAVRIFLLVISLMLFVLAWTTPVLLLIAFPSFCLSLWWFWRSRRNPRDRSFTRYWANFTFAGGGSSNISYADLRTSIFTYARTERQPDYAVWSEDEDWTRNLIAAANEAIIAARA